MKYSSLFFLVLFFLAGPRGVMFNSGQTGLPEVNSLLKLSFRHIYELRARAASSKKSRIGACKELGHIISIDSDHINGLGSRRRFEFENLQSSAAVSLGDFGNDAVPQIRRALHGRSLTVKRTGLLAALACFNARLISDVRPLLKAPDPVVRERAQIFLKEVKKRVPQ